MAAARKIGPVKKVTLYGLATYIDALNERGIRADAESITAVTGLELASIRKSLRTAELEGMLSTIWVNRRKVYSVTEAGRTPPGLEEAFS